MFVLEGERTGGGDEGGAVADFCAVAHRHGAGEDVELVALGDGHQGGDQLIGAVHDVGEFGGEVGGFYLRAGQDHGEIFWQDQQIGPGHAGLGGQALDAGEEEFEIAWWGHAEGGEGELHRVLVQKTRVLVLAAGGAS